MVDSNDTIAYENGRDDGYDYGYYEGQIDFANTLIDKLLLSVGNVESNSMIHISDLIRMIENLKDEVY